MMLHIILLILKIILWIILAIVLIALAIIGLVLFSPVRYRINGEFDENISVTVKLRFLIVSLFLTYNKDESVLDIMAKVAGIKVYPAKPKKDKKPKKAKRAKKVKKPKKSKKPRGLEKTDNLVKPDNFPKPDGSAGTNGSNESKDSNNSNGDSTQSKKQKKSLKEVLNKIKEKLNKIKEKAEYISRKKDRFLKFMKLKYVERFRKYLGKYLIGLLKHIAPRKVKGHIRYGMKEPCDTGKVTGIISLMPFAYSKDFHIMPDFENKVIEGKVCMKGRIRIGYIARIILKRDLWRTIKAAKKI